MIAISADELEFILRRRSIRVATPGAVGAAAIVQSDEAALAALSAKIGRARTCVQWIMSVDRALRRPFAHQCRQLPVAVLLCLPLWGAAYSTGGQIVSGTVRSTAYGTTLITHGLNGDVDGWVTGMANQIPTYSRFPATNFTCYQMYFYPTGGNFHLRADRVSGIEPLASASGGIVVKLDWRDLSDGSDYDTYQVAVAVDLALQSTNYIPELGGHALAELPLHLIGHSRGASLVCELSRLLGTNGVWLDQLTTLDAHPLNDDHFPLDRVLYDVVDAPVATYENVLFHDCYWQDQGQYVFGMPAAGAYVRKLTNLDGGYGGLSGPHSDVHLWYHASLDSRATANDSEASLTSSARSSWYSTYESKGKNAGFLYSLIGGGNRRSTDRPLGAGNSAIRDGFNQWWDLGAGTSSNRTRLTANSGAWPNLIQFNRTTTNRIEQGQAVPLRLCYQWARLDTHQATISILLDNDANPLNSNETMLQQLAVPGNGADTVSFVTTNLVLNAALTPPGQYALLARISGDERARYLYAPELLEVIAGRAAPVLNIVQLSGHEHQIRVGGLAGQTIILQTSSDLKMWVSLATNRLSSSRWDYTAASPNEQAMSFFRAVLP